MKKNIDKFMLYLTTITQEESDFIEHVLNWTDKDKIAFRFAKRIFEENNEKKQISTNKRSKIK